MSILILGGTGFIGRRLVPLLAQRGEEIVCMDINPQTAEFYRPRQAGAGDPRRCQPVRRRHGAMTVAKPSRVINLAYWLGSEHPPRVAFKLNILGMDNCFEAARVSSASTGSPMPARWRSRGEQKFYGDRIVTEDDFRHGHVQYAMHKIFNEWQAQDYREKHGMEITAIRPANVTGPDKIVGSVDHVFCITDPARGKPVSVPVQGRDALPGPCRRNRRDLCPRHHDRQAAAHGLQHRRPAISLGEIADIVRDFLPDAQITFDKETGGKELSRQLSDRQYPARAGIRRPVPPLPRARAADHQRYPAGGRTFST